MAIALVESPVRRDCAAFVVARGLDDFCDEISSSAP